jgi:sugar/nucleoside kinase (ribokinase family)
MVGKAKIHGRSRLRKNRSSRPYDLVTFGDLCVDLIMTGEDIVPEFGQVEKLVGDYHLEMGGSCSIFACQAARLGMRVALLGRVGADMLGELMIDSMQQAGVDTRYVIVDPAYKTGLGIALSTGNDRAILTYPGALDAIEPADIPEKFLESADHLHHGSYFLHTRLRPHIPTIFKQARELGLTISLDTNWDPEEEWGYDLAEIFPLVDIFFPNEQEALRIARAPDAETAGNRLLATGIRLVAVKRGEGGALLMTLDELIACQVEPALPGGDGIGAGDSFDAGFLSAWLRGLPLETCLKIGCFCGRAVASAVGGVKGQPGWDVIRKQFL